MDGQRPPRHAPGILTVLTSLGVFFLRECLTFFFFFLSFFPPSRRITGRGTATSATPVCAAATSTCQSAARGCVSCSCRRASVALPTTSRSSSGFSPSSATSSASMRGMFVVFPAPFFFPLLIVFPFPFFFLFRLILLFYILVGGPQNRAAFCDG